MMRLRRGTLWAADEERARCCKVDSVTESSSITGAILGEKCLHEKESIRQATGRGNDALLVPKVGRIEIDPLPGFEPVCANLGLPLDTISGSEITFCVVGHCMMEPWSSHSQHEMEHQPLTE